MGEAYPELGRAQALIAGTLQLEEVRFRETLGRGLRHLDEATEKPGPGETLPGEVAFKLYDTYRFPVLLPADLLHGQGRAPHNAGYDTSRKRVSAGYSV